MPKRVLSTTVSRRIQAIVSIAVVGAVALVVPPFLVLSLPIGIFLIGLEAYSTASFFPFLSVEKLVDHEPFFAHPVAYTVVQWCLLAAANLILSELGVIKGEWRRGVLLSTAMASVVLVLLIVLRPPMRHFTT